MMSKVSPEKREKWYNLENSVELMDFILGLWDKINWLIKINSLID